VAAAAWLACRPALPQEATASHVDLSLHARSSWASARVERAAWLSLTVPLDRLAAPRASSLAKAALADEAAVAEAAVEPSGASSAKAPKPATTPHPQGQPRPAPEVAAELARALAKVTAVADLSRRATSRALAAAGVAADRRRLDSLSTRSRASAALPEVRLRAQRSTDQDLRWAPTVDDPYRVTQADGAGLTLEASASFRLDRLVFTSDELAVERLRAQQKSEHLKLEQRVQEAVLGLFRAHEQACSAEPEAPARAQNVLRSLELIVELDALTAGWFSSEAPRFSRVAWGFSEAILGFCASPGAPSTIQVAGAGVSE